MRTREHGQGKTPPKKARAPGHVPRRAGRQAESQYHVERSFDAEICATIQSLSYNVSQESDGCVERAASSGQTADRPHIMCAGAGQERDHGGPAREHRLRNGEAVKIHSLVFRTCQRPAEEEKTVARIDLELSQLADPHVKSKRSSIFRWIRFHMLFQGSGPRPEAGVLPGSWHRPEVSWAEVG